MKSARIESHPDFPVPTGQKEIRFRFQGREITALEGDTVAAALIAAGVETFSRSFKYHRRRGLYDNAGYGTDTLLDVDASPNVIADRTLAREGMEIRTQNAWPSVGFDVMAVNDTVVPLLPNGFYYKMFHKPKALWPLAEKAIRKAAGIGRIDTSGRGTDLRYEKRYRFPDVCVVGGGPAGLSAAKAAAEEGKQVLLIEQLPTLGGHSAHTIPEHQRVSELQAGLEADDRVEILTNTSAFGVYEENLVAAVQGRDQFKIRAEAVVLAPGALERHLVFENNDLPGIMTGRASERLVLLHGVRPGSRAVVVTNHDGGEHTARVLKGAGVEVAAVVDARQGRTIQRAKGRTRVTAAVVGARDGSGQTETIPCDLIVIAVGYTPNLALLAMGRKRPIWDPEQQVFRSETLPDRMYACGEVQGPATLVRLLKEGEAAGIAAARLEPAPPIERSAEDRIDALPPTVGRCKGKAFVCRCMDVTTDEIARSQAEGFDQLEKLKRYTGLGMGICQGKVCYEAAARIVDPEIGPTTFRPPAVPVSFGVLAGRAPHLVPIRRTPTHDVHVRAGAKFLDVGQWKRPESYIAPALESKKVREGLGMIDVSTLGKIEVSGPDVQAFLHFMLPGKFKKLAVGRVRYGVMINEDGILFEDGTIAHIDEGRYVISTTTGNQDAILESFYWWQTTEGFDVRIRNLSQALAAMNLSGDTSRRFLSKLVEIDMSNEAFPYMGCRKATIEGVNVTLFRIGFTGDLSYEVHFPAEYGESMWELLMEKGKPYGLFPFGVETQRILRLEKGHLLPGVDTDALSTPYEAGVGFAVKDDKPDFIGRAFLKQFKERGVRDRLVLYKLKPGDPIPGDGVTIRENGKAIGRVTSSRRSPTLGAGIGLCWVPKDLAEPGSRITIRLADGRDVDGEVLEHAAYDPEGVKLKQ